MLSIKRASFSLAFSAFCLSFVFSPPALPSSSDDSYTIELNVQQCKNVPDVRVDVVAYSATDREKKTEFASLWYNAGRPLAFEQKAAFAVPKNKSVAITATNQPSPSYAELKATADALLRVALKSTLNYDKVVSVRVSDAAFNVISQEFQFHNLKIAANELPPVHANLSFQLEANAHRILFYY